MAAKWLMLLLAVRDLDYRRAYVVSPPDGTVNKEVMLLFTITNMRGVNYFPVKIDDILMVEFTENLPEPADEYNDLFLSFLGALAAILFFLGVWQAGNWIWQAGVLIWEAWK